MDTKIFTDHIVLILLTLCSNCCSLISVAPSWSNHHQIDSNFTLLWNVTDASDIVMELQVETLGLVGVGFSRGEALDDADVVFGWIENGRAYLQDRYIDNNASAMYDASQDYILLLGYENQTHSVLRLKRQLNTCDDRDDYKMNDDTIRLHYFYADTDPLATDALGPWYGVNETSYRGTISIHLMNFNNLDEVSDDDDDDVQTIELLNENVELPPNDDTLYWCKLFRFADFEEKVHVVKFEPMFDNELSRDYLRHITVYECAGPAAELEKFYNQPGQPCYYFHQDAGMACNAVALHWGKGSKGFTFPAETGYPLDSRQVQFYLMESHYNNPDFVYDAAAAAAAVAVAINEEEAPVDNSGLRLYITTHPRKYDSGVMTVGVDPNWRHMIPPEQEKVFVEGHCIGACTQAAFDNDNGGINIFAVLPKMQLIGTQVTLRQVRGTVELLPIVHDTNVDSNYQDYRRLPNPVKSLPGDQLIVECVYNSSQRQSITLGGMTTREEVCLVFLQYYPRQTHLTTCHSTPSLGTVLESLGVKQLTTGSHPIQILSPPELAGMSLEERLYSYDWDNYFTDFQRITLDGTFRPICLNAQNEKITKTDRMEVRRPNVTTHQSTTILSQCDPNINNSDVRMKSNEVKSDEDGSMKDQTTTTMKNNVVVGGGGGSSNSKSTSSSVESASGKKVVKSNSSKLLFESLMILPALFMASIISVV